MKATGKILALVCALLLSLPASSYPHGRTPIGRLGGTGGGGGGGATLVFSCGSFGGTGCDSSAINLAGTNPVFSGGNIILNNAIHSAGAAWRIAQQNIATGWTTDFTFKLVPDSVTGESVGTGDGSTVSWTHAAAGAEGETMTLLPGTVSVTAGAITGTDNGSGVITGTGIAAGSTVDYAAGSITVVFSSHPANGTAITTSYKAAGFGETFTVQNTNATTNPQAFGDNLSSDANGLGYGALEHLSQVAVANSFAVKFDCTSFNGTGFIGNTPSTTGLYLAGGPDIDQGMLPAEDMNPAGVSACSGDVIDVHLVYDGSALTMVAKDTNTGAQYREVWPLNAATVVGSSTAWVGITGGTVTPATQDLTSWSFWQGYNTRLSTPTISPAAGSYSTSQTVTITCPSGATCYYTTNGRLPTTSDTQYTSPITVNSSAVVQAVAVESNFTDSNVAQANYQIQASGPTINFPSGFASAAGLIAVNGAAQFTTTGSCVSGTCIQLVDGVNHPQLAEQGAAWYAVPVAINGFSTVFTLNFPNSSTSGYGITFTVQNYLPSSQDQNARTGPLVVSGGPNALGGNSAYLGYGGEYGGILSSVAVGIDLVGSSSNVCLISEVMNGATPGGGVGTSMSPVSCHDGNPLQVTLSYNNSTTTLSATVKECTTSACTTVVNTYSTSWTVNIPSIVGGNTAYVGFTAGAATYRGTLDVSNWTGF
jgi:hypothetical protein